MGHQHQWGAHLQRFADLSSRIGGKTGQLPRPRGLPRPCRRLSLVHVRDRLVRPEGRCHLRRQEHPLLPLGRHPPLHGDRGALLPQQPGRPAGRDRDRPASGPEVSRRRGRLFHGRPHRAPAGAHLDRGGERLLHRGRRRPRLRRARAPGPRHGRPFRAQRAGGRPLREPVEVPGEHRRLRGRIARGDRIPAHQLEADDLQRRHQPRARRRPRRRRSR